VFMLTYDFNILTSKNSFPGELHTFVELYSLP
jgi:hypothetical protein